MRQSVESRSCLIIVSDYDDLLSNQVATTSEAQGVKVLRFLPNTLGDLNVCLRDDFFWVNGQPVGGILFRSSPNSTFSDGFDEDDQSFCDAEIRALWLAALHLDSILTMNQYDAAAWFEGSLWSSWRRCLIGAGIPVSPFAFGSVTSVEGLWYPYGSQKAREMPGQATRGILGSAIALARQKQVSLVINQEVLAGKTTPSILATASLLEGLGVRFSGIVTDYQDRLLTIITRPTISNTNLAKLVSHRITGMYYEHLHRR